MKRQLIDRRRFMAFAGLALTFSGRPFAAAAQDKDKKVVFTTSYAANYCTHLYAAANINWKPSYPPGTCPGAEDRELLVRYRDLLAFGQGRTGAFTSFMYFLPVDLNVNDFNPFFTDLIAAFEKNDLADFFDRHPVDMNDPFIRQRYASFLTLPDETWETMVKPLLGAFREIAAVFTVNQACYRALWDSEVEPLLTAHAGRLNDFMTQYQYIGKWEELTGRTFAADSYDIILTHENRNGPDANSVAYDRNIFYYDGDPLHFRDFISHEIGTHLFIDLFDGDGDYDLRYAAVECLAYYLNRKVLGTDNLHYSLNGLQLDRFLPLYERYDEPGISYPELVDRVLAAAR